MLQRSCAWRTLLSLILAAALGAVAVAQQDEPVEAPAESPVEEPPLSLDTLEPPETDPVVVVAEGRGFAALRGPEVLWRIAHAPDTGPVSGPIVAPGGLIYAHGVRVLRVDPTTGRITGAWWLSGPVTGLAREDTSIDATVVTGAGGVTERFRIDPAGESGRLDRPMTPGTDAASRSWLRREARSVAPDAFDAPGRLPPGELTSAATRLIDAFRRDPTNPWTALSLGRILLVLGRVADAEALFDSALEPGRPAYEYGAMAAVLEAAGLHELADRAADRAESGLALIWHEPNLATSTLAAAATYDPRALATAAFRDGRHDRGRAWLERAVRVAPRLEGYESVYSQYAEWLEEQGQVAAAAAWRSRLRELQADTLLGLGEDASLRVAAQAINLYLGLAAATVALLLYLTIRAWAAQGKDLAGHGGRYGSWLRNPFLRARHTSLGYATFTEKLVLFGLAAAAYLTLVGAVWMTSEARQDFAVPFVLASGQLGGAESRAFLSDRAAATREGRLLLALALHAGGDRAATQGLYEQLVAQTGKSALLLVNLGAMAELQGETAEAVALYREALELDPGLLEARVNAARVGETALPGALAVIQRDRLEFHDRYRADQPILVVPSPVQVAAALGATRASFLDYLAPNKLIEETPEAWRQVRGPAGAEWVAIVTVATALWVFATFIFVLVPPPGPRGPHGPVSGLTGLVLPGTALAEEPWGFLVLLASGYAAVLTLAGFLWGPPGILGPVVTPVDLGLGVPVRPGVAPIPIEQWAPWVLAALYAVNAIVLTIGWLRPRPRPGL
jgi:tetratricopeptide (TPR) repeat protein